MCASQCVHQSVCAHHSVCASQCVCVCVVVYTCILCVSDHTHPCLDGIDCKISADIALQILCHGILAPQLWRYMLRPQLEEHLSLTALKCHQKFGLKKQKNKSNFIKYTVHTCRSEELVDPPCSLLSDSLRNTLTVFSSPHDSKYCT